MALNCAPKRVVNQRLVAAITSHRFEMLDDRRVEHDADALFAQHLGQLRARGYLPFGFGNLLPAIMYFAVFQCSSVNLISSSGVADFFVVTVRFIFVTFAHGDDTNSLISFDVNASR